MLAVKIAVAKDILLFLYHFNFNRFYKINCNSLKEPEMLVNFDQFNLIP